MTYRGLTLEEQERRAYANGDVERAELLRKPPFSDSERESIYNSGYEAGYDAGRTHGYEKGYEDACNDGD